MLLAGREQIDCNVVEEGGVKTSAIFTGAIGNSTEPNCAATSSVIRVLHSLQSIGKKRLIACLDVMRR